MLINIYTIYDQQAQTYARPMFFPNDATAKRAVGDEVNRHAPDNSLAMHPDDYQLYHLGTFNDDTGELKPNDRPTLVAHCKQLSKQPGISMTLGGNHVQK